MNHIIRFYKKKYVIVYGTGHKTESVIDCFIEMEYNIK